MEGSPRWSLGPLSLDPEAHDPQGVQWFLIEEKGFWAAPGNNADLTERLNAHGAYRSPGWKKERTIELSGRAYADDMNFATLRTAAHRITGLLSDPDEPISLTCHSEAGERTCLVFLDGDILTQPAPVAVPCIEWSLQVVAPDPRLYATSWRTVTVGIAHPATGDGLDFEQADPKDTHHKGLDFTAADADFPPHTGLLFGKQGSTGLAAPENHGTAPTPPVFTLHGPLDHPSLICHQKGRDYKMTYNDKLAEGESLVIDPSVPSVLLAGKASRREKLNPAQFTGFYIPGGDGLTPGKVAFGLSHAAAWTAGHCDITYRDAWF